ncbi:MAG: NAD(P)-dependent oxidoreductase [Gemmatimonadaceae bacterium]|nr:NAD(P)-dependent oxidoreductase [Gemmatimonadaceae bacterium]
MTASASPSIAFIGTGLIGTPMVERLLECGRQVTVWNRTRDKLAPLLAAGAKEASSARACADGAALVCLCLTDTTAVEEVMFGNDGVATVLNASQLVIDLSSIAPDATARMATRLREQCGAHWLDAPVSGGTPAARAGRLIVFAGGEADDITRAAPVFDALSQRVTHMGGNGAGQLAKSCNQQLVACNLMVIAEMIAFAEKSGVDASRMPAALAGGWADSLPLQVFGPRMAGNIDTPRLGAVATFRKDIEQVVRLAEDVGADVPITYAALSEYRRAIADVDIGPDADASRLVRLRRTSEDSSLAEAFS